MRNMLKPVPAIDASVYHNHSAFTMEDHLTVGIVLIGFGCLALIGNLLVLLIFIWFRSLRTPTNLLLATLAFTDLAMACLGFPFTAASSLSGRWLFGGYGCYWYAFNGMLFGYSSIGMLTAISIDRYVSICRRDMASASLYYYYALMIGCVYLNALVWAIMPILGWGRYGLEPSLAACTIAWWDNDVFYVSYVITVFLMCYVMPATIMLYCYYKSISFIRKVGSGGAHENVEWTNEKDITKTCMICVLLFVIAWSPYAIICLWAAFWDPSTIPVKLSITPALFAKTSSFYNPIVYVAANRRYRRAVLCMLQGKGRDTNLDAVPMQQLTTMT